MKTTALFLVTNLLFLSTFGQTGKILNHRYNESQNARYYHPGIMEHISLKFFHPKISLKNGVTYQQKLDCMLYYVCDELADEWVIDYKSHYQFNEQGLIIEFYDFRYDHEIGSWIPNDRETYKYTENGELKQTIRQMSDKLSEIIIEAHTTMIKLSAKFSDWSQILNR